MTQFTHTIRQTKNYSKGYINNLLEAFTPLYVQWYNKSYRNDKVIKYIDFAKQDMRGVPSITLFDERGCVPHQEHFSNYAEMIAFIQGFMKHA